MQGRALFVIDRRDRCAGRSRLTIRSPFVEHRVQRGQAARSQRHRREGGTRQSARLDLDRREERRRDGDEVGH